MVIINGPRTTLNVLQARRVIPAEGISFVDPNLTPLVSALGNSGFEMVKGKDDNKRVGVSGVPLMKKLAKDAKYRWFEDALESRTDDFDGAEANVAETVLTVTDGTKFAAGMIILNTSTSEYMRVASVATNDITVKRGFGGSTATAILDAEVILIISYADAEGVTSRAARNTQSVEVFNYTQIFRTPFEVTETANASEMYGGKDMDYLRRTESIEHKKDMERAFWFGVRAEDTAVASTPLRTTQGIYTRLVAAGAATTAAGGALSETEWNTFMRQVFANGSTVKYIFCSDIVLDAVSGFSNSKLQTAVEDKRYGVAISEYISPHGRAKLVRQPLFVGAFSGLAIGVDMEKLRYRFLNARDTRLKTNIQANDADTRKDEFITEAGIELKNAAEHHAYLTGVTS